MPKDPEGKVNIMVHPFDGDPQLLKFFVQQIQDSKSLNKLSSEQTASLIRSKLSGAALKFVVASPDLLNAKEHTALLDGLSDFFVTTSATALCSQPLALLKDENIKNLAHRVAIQVAQQFPSIKDKDALDQIKLVKLCEALPNQVRAQLLREEIKEFSKAVARAAVLHEIDAQTTLNENQQFSILHAEIVALKQQLNEATTQSKAVNHFEAKSQGPQNNKQVRKLTSQRFDRNRHQNNNVHKKFNNDKITKICRYCKKSGHLITNCYKLRNKKSLEQAHLNNPWNQPQRDTRYFQSGSNQQLNPNAPNFNSNVHLN